MLQYGVPQERATSANQFGLCYFTAQHARAWCARSPGLYTRLYLSVRREGWGHFQAKTLI